MKIFIEEGKACKNVTLKRRLTKMVSNELLDIYKRLNERGELFKKAIRRSNSISGLGIIILFLTIIPIIPSIMQLYIGMDFLSSLALGIMIGLLLIVIGRIIKQRTPLPPKLSIEEEAFLKVVDSLKSLDTYLDQQIEFSRLEAAKDLSKVVKCITEPSWSSYSLWERLTKEANESLRQLKRNLKEKIIPRINQGKEEDIKMVYPIIEGIARYLLDPTASKLKELNESMSGLKPISKEKAVLIPFLDRHPYLRHCLILLVNGFCSSLVFYIGVNFLHISVDSAFIGGTTLFGTLTAGYMAVVTRKGWRGVT
jgi:hypothetical protein